jgi:DNA segregation ATPase FtsK/SpoIIIE-like protein
MAELSDEMSRRKELFKAYPTVETLMDYNKSGTEPLPFIVVFVDEVTNLFMTRETQAITLEMLREARAFGLYFIAMGQSWSHREMVTSIRQQFRTGMHFGTNDPASSRMIVNSSDAVKITTPGRALASLPFGMSPGAVEIQTPYIDAATVLANLSEAAVPPTRPMPPAAATGLEEGSTHNGLQPTSKQAQVLALWDRGIMDKKIISRQVYGQVGGSQYQLIEATLSKFGRI